jgi:hypothetical protein
MPATIDGQGPQASHKAVLKCGRQQACSSQIHMGTSVKVRDRGLSRSPILTAAGALDRGSVTPVSSWESGHTWLLPPHHLSLVRKAKGSRSLHGLTPLPWQACTAQAWQPRHTSLGKMGLAAARYVGLSATCQLQSHCRQRVERDMWTPSLLHCRGGAALSTVLTFSSLRMLRSEWEPAGPHIGSVAYSS